MYVKMQNTNKLICAKLREWGVSSAACVVSPSKWCSVVVSAGRTVLHVVDYGIYCVINSHIFVWWCRFYSQNESSARRHELLKIIKKGLQLSRYVWRTIE
jgi:hypothetical protein